MVFAIDVLVDDGALVFVWTQSQNGLHVVAVFIDIFLFPEIELLSLEQLFAVGFNAYQLGRVGIAFVVVDYFVQLLLQL